MTMRNRIKELCKENGISMNKLEKTLQFGTGYISKLDNSTPNTKKLQLIADYFNVSVDYLMTGKEIKHEIYNEESAHLVGKIRRNKELTDALLKYFELPEKKQKLVLELINTLSEE